jgi:hypothetical protein
MRSFLFYGTDDNGEMIYHVSVIAIDLEEATKEARTKLTEKYGHKEYILRLLAIDGVGV